MRFLKKDEYGKTKELAKECFGDSADLDDYYNNDVRHNRIAVYEKDENIVSMLHLKRVICDFEEQSLPVWYIAYVATKKDYRGKGYMKDTVNYVLDSLKREGEPFTFLVPVNPDIYTGLGFTFKWRFNKDESDILYADDGLEYCFACSLNAKVDKKPVRISRLINVY